ncbi:MAG: prepilin peptidase [Clostridia bacterium]|nr:prepilin peptidase [Clostridia bacterium]
MEEYIHLVWSIFIFVTGLLFGSFFTLATYRIPRKLDIVKSRSFCPNCKHKLGFFDCFPILSYVSTLGRCRYCRKPISIRYPIIELASGFAFLIPYLFFGFSWQFFIVVITYVYAMLYIGIDVMRYKMTDEEKEEVKKQREDIKKKKLEKKNNNKTGALSSEIIVAIGIFMLFFVSSIFALRNYYGTLSLTSKKSEALNICLNNINNEKSKDYASIANRNGTTKIGNTEYAYEIKVSDYIKNGTEVVSGAKVIESIVTFESNDKIEEVSLKCIKVE